MLRSMYSGISGLRNFQTKLDVIGNNISNVNTYGFKKGRTIFKDLISQTVAGASEATDTRGGVNPKQIGLGSQIAAIDTLHTAGSTQFTGNTLDLAISGDGFFQVADGVRTGTNNELTGFSNVLYTRAGNFYMDQDGYLVNSDGKYLVGYAAEISGGNYAIPTTNPKEKPILIPITAQSMSIGQDGMVTFVDDKGELQTAGQLLLAKFSNPGGLTKNGGNYFEASPNSGNPTVNSATTSGLGSINSGFLEMSNVDLAEEFTEMIVAQRGFQANTRIITTSDEILQELVNLKR
ncbi:flagellar basal body rod protein FlgG [Sporosarcina sp. HYO08]|uniref:flagellar basal body rod protein FlgG n=1 Tax=Sporosarcina sp. HYO08 TaxID=1759557 RepID=UPI0007959873|nr:flagellar basal body rod protein FlgG [Sporosarcina sp. HYO08]KXH79986.1 flagellar basal-body rod protein FlgG [Sporosarcina sp. HYO08]